MRIAHFGPPCAPDGANGVSQAIHDLSRTQAGMGDDVAVFGVSEGTWVPIEGVPTRVCSPASDPIRVPAPLLDELRRWKPDVVHVHSVYVPAHVTLTHRLRSWRVPYVVTPHGGLSPYVMRRRTLLKWPYKHLCQLPLLNRAAFVHALADQADIRAYGVRRPVVVVPMGIDAGSIPGDPRPGAIVRRFPAADGKRRFLFLGRLDPLQKGLDLLIRAFHRALATTRGLVLVLVGPDRRGAERELRGLADRLGVEGDVLFWGPAFGREKYELIHDADVFVHSSRWEGQIPYALMEALACGKPCLVSRAADPTGLVEAYGAGERVEPAVDRIAEALVRFARADCRTLAERGRGGRLLVAREFTWRRTAETLRAAYLRYATRPAHELATGTARDTVPRT